MQVAYTCHSVGTSELVSLPIIVASFYLSIQEGRSIIAKASLKFNFPLILGIIPLALTGI